MRLFLCLLSLVAVACAPVAFSQLPDISGVHIGMSMEEAKAKVGSGYAYTSVTSNDPNIKFQIAQKTTDAWVFETIGGQLAYAQHAVAFEQQHQPVSGTTLSRLIQKYGPIPKVMFGQVAWAFNSSGAPLVASDQVVASCGNDPFQLGASLNSPGPYVMWRHLSVPLRAPSGCGISVKAEGVSNDPQSTVLMQEFDIYIADVNALHVEGERQNAARQQQQTNELNKAKQNKAPF